GGLSGPGYLVNIAPQDEAVVPVTVNNLAPVVEVRGVANATPGQYTLTAFATDTGTLDTLIYNWQINGVTASTGTSVTFNAATTSATAGVLTVTDDDTGSVTYRTQVVIGTGAGETIPLTNTQTAVGATNIAIPSGTNKVIVYGLAGNDTINAGAVTGFPVELIGGDGNDTLTGGSLGDVLVGAGALGDYPGTDPATAGIEHGADSLSGGA